MIDFAAMGVWAALSAPACAAYAVAAANRARIDGPVGQVGPLLTLVFASAAAVVVASAATPIEAVKHLILAAALAYLAAFDLRAMAVPVWPALAGVMIGVSAGAIDGSVVERFLAALSGWTAFLAIDLLYRRLRGRSGLGSGDALVAALIGAWLSLEGLAWSVAIGGLVGIAWALIAGRRNDQPMPFVPALAAGAALYLILEGLLR